MYNSILARSFSRQEQKRLRYGAIVCSLLVLLFFCSFLKPHLSTLTTLNLKLSMGFGLRMLALKDWQMSTNNTSMSLQMVNSTSKFEERLNVSIIGSPLYETVNRSWTILNPSSIDLSKKKPTNVSTTSATAQHHSNSLISTAKPQRREVAAKTSIVEAMTKKTDELRCKTEEPRTEYCDFNMDVMVDGKSSTVLFVSSQMNIWSIRPYARKEDKTAMSHVRKWSIKSLQDHKANVKCTKNHSVPGILFSVGGYVGNNFHDFTDVVIPLFITSRKYNREVKFLISDKRPWWIAKFKPVLKGLSKYEFIDIDNENKVHCFPSLTIGLKRHPKELTIDPSKHKYSMGDFREFLRESFSLKRAKAIKIKKNRQKRPRLLIISRRRTRAFKNVGEISKMATSLGFKVIVTEADMQLSKFAEIVNSCDVLLGVHGAGLTNMVFLPESAILIQVLPIGRFEWLGTTDFGEPSKDMNLKYLDYQISKNESTLIEQYPLDHLVFADPHLISKQGWGAFKEVYLDKQNVKVNVNRFRSTLLKALELLHQ